MSLKIETTSLATGYAKGTDSYKTGEEAARKAKIKFGVKNSDLILVFMGTQYNFPEVIKGIRSITGTTPLIGCTTAGEFTEEIVGKGLAAVGMLSIPDSKIYVGIGQGLRKNRRNAVTLAKEGFPSHIDGYPYKSAVTLIDGMAGQGEEAVEELLYALGTDTKFGGGAAGDDCKFKETWVFCNDKALTDALTVALIFSKTPFGLGVKHGHTPATKPLFVTKSDGNIVKELNGRPAFEEWKEQMEPVAKKSGINLNTAPKDQISSFLLANEAGIVMGKEFKVRAPLQVNPDKSIQFACEIPEGLIIRGMSSEKEDQIKSAKEATEIAVKNLGGKKASGGIIFDCICRSLYLGEDFKKAVDGIKETVKAPVIGFETYGEIMMVQGQLSGMHNTTTVAMVF